MLGDKIDIPAEVQKTIKDLYWKFHAARTAARVAANDAEMYNSELWASLREVLGEKLLLDSRNYSLKFETGSAYVLDIGPAGEYPPRMGYTEMLEMFKKMKKEAEDPATR